MLKSFASDNNSGIHKCILESINQCNTNDYISYGSDPYTKEAEELFREVFGREIEVFFMLTGTGANICALQSITDRFNAIICPSTAHINVDECGAIEHSLGVKIIGIDTANGKLNVSHIDKYLNFKGDQHHVQPKVISITQATELGTVYTIKELENIVSYAKLNGFKVHVDGSRLSNAAVYLNCSLKNLTSDIGIDVLSFGGTKNGMMLGEAVVIFDKNDAANFRFIRKQNMQLVSKMRFIAAQFIPYLKEELWYTNAKQANEMALLLYEKLKENCGEILMGKPESNAVFVKLDKAIAEEMQKERFFYSWDEEAKIYRFMTSFDMNKDDVEEFVGFCKQLTIDN